MKITTKPAVGYVRMSIDQQQDSPARQRQDIEALAERMGYHILRWYEDHGLTGTESSKRKDFQKLLADAKAKTFCAVLLSEQSRMSREDIFDAMQHWRAFRDAGVAIVTCQRGELKFDNLGGVITEIVDQYGAREESIRIADRSLSGKRLAVSRGQRQSGGLFGYDREILDEQGRVVRRVHFRERFAKPALWSTRIVISNDVEAVEAVRFMFESVADGVALSTVAKQLNRRGVLTTSGKPFSGVKVKRTVTNPAYAGELVFSQRKRAGKFPSLYDEGGMCCTDAHDAIITRDLWDRAQRAIAGRSRQQRSKTPGRYLLNGLVFLADGDLRLRGKVIGSNLKGGPIRYYTVSSHQREERPDQNHWPHIAADKLEQAVLSKLRSFLSNAKHKRAIQNEIARRNRRATVDTAHLEKALAEVRSKVERGTENLALASRDDIPGLTKLLARWRDEEKDLRERLERLTTATPLATEAVEIIERMDGLLERLAEADRQKLACAIRQTVGRIILRKETRGSGDRRIELWDGVIELNEDAGVRGSIELTNADLPTSSQWWRVTEYVARQRGVVFLSDVANAFRINAPTASKVLAQAVLSGRVVNLGHQKGWTAAE